MEKIKIDKRKLRPTKRDNSLTTPARRNAFFAKHLSELKPEIEQLIISGLSRAEIIEKLVSAGFPKINPATLTGHLKKIMPEIYAEHLGRKKKAPVSVPASVPASVPGHQLSNLDSFKVKLFNIAATANTNLQRSATPLSFYDDLIKEQKRRFDNNGDETMGWSINKLNAGQGFTKDLKLDVYSLIERNKELLTESNYTYLNYYLEQIGFNK